MTKIYDLVIVGAGPAGITASVYAARKRMDFLVISQDVGGQAAWSGDIENYTGYQFISGPELAAKFEEHMRQYNISVQEPEVVSEIKKAGDLVSIKSNKSEYQAKTVIVASGKRVRELGVPGEKEFKNRGLTYCATCDGPLFSGRDVAIIGGGNSALDAALQMIKIAKHIYLINVALELTGDAIMQDKVKTSPLVTILNNTKVKEIQGDKMVNRIVVSGAEEKNIAVTGVFVEIGLIPNSNFALDITKNELGEIVVDFSNRTNVPGIFAAGDVTNVPEKQIIIAAGEGSKALLGAFRYLAEHK